MIKIAILTDIHANYPALIEAIKKIKELKCDLIYHLGDAISLGPFPEETIVLWTLTLHQ